MPHTTREGPLLALTVLLLMEDGGENPFLYRPTQTGLLRPSLRDLHYYTPHALHAGVTPCYMHLMWTIAVPMLRCASLVAASALPLYRPS